jgi:Peptidase family M28
MIRTSTRSGLAAGLALLATLSIHAAARRAPAGAEDITANQLRAYLTFVAADEMEGRDTPSRGLDITANYLASQLQRWGVKPAGDEGTFFQRISLLRRKVDPAKTTAALGDRTYVYGDDFLASSHPGGEAKGPLVYIGYGLVFKAKNLDPYKGLDVKGKFLVIHQGLPPGVSQTDLKGKDGDDYETTSHYAARNGAAGILVVPDMQTLMTWKTTRQAAVDRGSIQVERLQDGTAVVPQITASPAMIGTLFGGEKLTGAEVMSRAFARTATDPFELGKDKILSVTIAANSEKLRTQNVVGILEGRDPVLRNEYVAVGAHYDHIGIRPGSGDTIYNGADDDGSGTVAVLAIAEAFARQRTRPRRSLLFVWHAGEEKGLWGSALVTKFPPVPIERIVAQINIDMIGRSRPPGDTKPANQRLTGPDEIYIVGSTMMSTELGELAAHVNEGYLGLTLNRKYDDPKDPERIYFRSDHYNYAKRGVPVLFFFDGVHEDYHRPSDSVDKIDFAKMEKVTRTIYAIAARVADLPSRPRIDKPLPAQLTQ